MLEFLYNNCGKKNKANREKWLKNSLSILPECSKILDAGAGELQYKKYCSHLNYFSQDFGQYDGNGDGQGIQTAKRDNTKLDIISDIVEIPVENESFDSIFCVEVFEHIPDPSLAIAEFSRILKNDGILIVTVPVCSLTHYAPYYYYNGFSKYFFENFFEKYNFEILELSYNGNWFEYIAQEIHRLPFVLYKYCGLKPLKLVKTFTEILFLPILTILSVASKFDNGSSEILSFGINIRAKKSIKN